MSPNPIFDTIEDEILALLERRDFSPAEFTLRLDEETMEAVLKAGMTMRNGQPIPEGTKKIVVRIAGHRIHLISEDEVADLDEIDSIH